ncbi:MAG: hypothetical protein ACI9F9_003262 [Candidatus Paceibacteria bacterium]|jgi:hypothetical protein
MTSKVSSWGRAIGLALFAFYFLNGSVAAQKLLNKKLPANAAENDPYTEGGDPELMAAAGILSHGAFLFATSDVPEIDKYMGNSDIRWLETEHFELGFALGPYRVAQKEKKTFLAALTKLSERLPTVKPGAKVIDPWLRAHLYAMRMEECYEQFLALVQMEQKEFPAVSGNWNRQGTYPGEGPHMGQRGKFEVLILPAKAVHLDFLDHHYGLQLDRTQRWNVIERDSITLTIHVEQGSLKEDAALHGHLAFNLAHNLFDGLKHYSYDTPIWLHEGLAHWMERSINPKHNSFDGSEGSVPATSKVKDWEAEVRKIVSKGKAPRMAALVRLNNYGQMDLPAHYCTWAMVDYLQRTRPADFGALIRDLKGRTTPEGQPDGSNLPDVHRDLFKQHFKMSYSAFDSAWAEWVLATY